jgi:hypothetical protein
MPDLPEQAMRGIEREYEYKPKWTTALLSGGSFALCAAFFAIRASGNDRGLLINGLIALSPAGATSFYWVLFGLSAAFVAAAALLVFHRLRFRQRIAFTPDAVLLPRSRWSAEERRVAYRAITGLSRSEAYGQRLLRVSYDGGAIHIVASMLPSREAFEEITALLSERRRSGARD